MAKARRLQSNLERDIARYSHEKETTEARIDNLKNDKRKLLREVGLQSSQFENCVIWSQITENTRLSFQLRDADARITELTTETVHNQKIIEQLKKK